MKLFKLANQFSKDEDGAVTVDWVVLTAALVGIALIVIGTVKTGIEEASTDVMNELTSAL